MVDQLFERLNAGTISGDEMRMLIDQLASAGKALTMPLPAEIHNRKRRQARRKLRQ